MIRIIRVFSPSRHQDAKEPWLANRIRRLRERYAVPAFTVVRLEVLLPDSSSPWCLGVLMV
jgi:hypothetical protein